MGSRRKGKESNNKSSYDKSCFFRTVSLATITDAAGGILSGVKTFGRTPQSAIAGGIGMGAFGAGAGMQRGIGVAMVKCRNKPSRRIPRKTNHSWGGR